MKSSKCLKVFLEAEGIAAGKQHKSTKTQYNNCEKPQYKSYEAIIFSLISSAADGLLCIKHLY